MIASSPNRRTDETVPGVIVLCGVAERSFRRLAAIKLTTGAAQQLTALGMERQVATHNQAMIVPQTRALLLVTRPPACGERL